VAEVATWPVGGERDSGTAGLGGFPPMGDEVRPTQGGNNNADCQGNELSWFDWALVTNHADVHRFVGLLIERRLLRTVGYERRRMSLTALIEQADKTLRGVKRNRPDWGDRPHRQALSAQLR
jgi:isoamylase